MSISIGKTGVAHAQDSVSAGRGRRVRAEPPQPGPPATVLPNLDEARHLPAQVPRAPLPIPSIVRSRHKPLEPGHGRKIGDPLPPPSAPAGINVDGSYLAFLPVRFLVAPSDDQLRFLAGDFPFFAVMPLAGPEASFSFFAPPVPQASGSKIAFASNRDGRVQLYVMNSDGSGQYRLDNGAGNDDAPRFSPDGSKILFQSDRDDPASGANDIYVMSVGGGGQTRLTTDPNDDSAPSWSPDGSKVVFQSLRDGQHYQIYLMNADGGVQVNLSNSPSNDRQPAWSPNGSKVAFASDRDRPGYASVYAMNADGTGQQRLTFGSGEVIDEQPAWSRDGSRIAFVSTRDGNKEVYVMNADGTGQTRLTDDPGNDDSPSWSPDGSKVVFRSDRERDCCDPTSQMWAMNADGTGPANLSGNQYGDYGANWTSSGGNQPPVAVTGGSYSGVTGQNTMFDGGGSFDPDGSVASYSWSFGDGGTASGVSPSHAYASAGTYTVTLTVTDNLGAQSSVTTTAGVSSSSGDQFAQNFLRWGLGRQPRGDEGSYWSDIMRAAYPKGQGSMLLAMREFGMTVFESAEYASRGRSDHWYVYDLYKSYLMREPDPQGWAWWESRVPEMGREQLRHAFDESIEFNNIVATLTADGTPSAAVSSLATARVDPFNQTGDQLRARDCEWGVTLLSLPGRAGLDLGLGLSYSSLVWTRSGPYAYFDEDRGSPSPGFTLGFATIRGPFFDARVGRNVYVLVTSSGRKVELRQVGTSNTYEAGDSSYLQLIAGGESLLLRSTDGTRVSYSNSVNGWRAASIEDRNGNLLSVSHDWRGDLRSVTDTLGRVVTFNYDANANLESITQTWLVNGVPQTHVWASFGWGTQALLPGFSAVAAVGAYSGEVIPVLTQVGLQDGSRYNFEYNAAGQVKAISRRMSDNVERSHTSYDYATLADDCPRIIGTRVAAENWTGANGVPSEVVTLLGDPGDGSHTMTAPDGTVYKDIYGAGWKRGLVTESEVRSGGALQRRTVTEWEQDDTAAAYQTNPRVIETNVYDFPADAPGNRRRTTTDYGPYAQYGLPHLVTEYGAGGAGELRRTYTDYNLSQPYLDRRIIGLVSETKVYDPADAKWLAKTTYAYDEAGSIQPQATSATNHDQSFDHLFLARGNATSVSRWDAEDIKNAGKAHTSRMTYNAAGSPLTNSDPLGHQNSIVYADSFSDGVNTRGTFAYPTTLTDAEGFSSTVRYNFDFGARMRFEGPPPEGQPNGLIQTFAYDAAARIERVTTENNGAFTRYVYGTYYVQQYSAVNAATDESYSIQTFDGAGRVVGEAANHPGSAGGYRASLMQYDLMGRLSKRSNPSEITGSWAPAGDDAAGWLYTRQTYDWKGRPRITTNTDGHQKSAAYEGCGCAGGGVVTLTDEVGRRQKVYVDPLGRRLKTEVLNPDGSVYSTTAETHDALDRVTRVRQYQGTDQSGVYQDAATTFDGYGRIESRHTPGQDVGRGTTYSYNDDGTLASVRDARGAKAVYGYDDDRHLVTSVSYDLSGVIPNQNVRPAAEVTFAYDAAGNRTRMQDGVGVATYAYDSLSRLGSESRQFAGLAGTYTLGYTYNLAGGLKSVADSSDAGAWAGARVDYDYDAAGTVTGVRGTGFGTVTRFASGIRRRAWGAVKAMDYGNGTQASRLYDARMRPTLHELKNVVVTPGQQPTTLGSESDYYADGRVSYARDLQNGNFDRAYRYDDAGRLKEAYSGREARGLPALSDPDNPFRQSYTYDVWGNMGRTGRLWINGMSDTPAYTNNRRGDWDYDAEGNVTAGALGRTTHAYDAAGRDVRYFEDDFTGTAIEQNTIEQIYGGDGAAGRRVESRYTEEETQTTTVVTTTYYLRSTALGGQVVAEVDSTGLKRRGMVYLGGTLLAEQRADIAPGAVTWRHEDAGRGSYVEADAGRQAVRRELDPLGADVGTSDPYEVFGGSYGRVMADEPLYQQRGNPFDPAGGCGRDGVAVPCGYAMEEVNRGAAEIIGGLDALKGTGMPVPEVVMLRRQPPFRDTDSRTVSYIRWHFSWAPNVVEPQEPSKPSFERRRAQDNPRTPCATMAALAQGAANEALEDAGDNLADAVERFDEIFNGMWYVGERVTGISVAQRLRENNFSGRQLTRDYFGQEDFRQEFREADRNGNLLGGDHDQTHHFATYFSAGINSYAVGALRFGQWAHRNLDNIGDNRLGSAGFTLGRELSADPNMLHNIGRTIRDRICVP